MSKNRDEIKNSFENPREPNPANISMFNFIEKLIIHIRYRAESGYISMFNFIEKLIVHITVQSQLS
jgi:hypothetical protein